ncbi:cadmium-translocating P-type ATPase [Enterococcus sp. 10A9_DIV0425]|uniref:Cd(2+)-exporting ATPase n=1 Tax=Candidatus Enterococcus wittei TaxID=1987383 RepID=A0A2C9XSV7_9ENTE|nr:heavy metal translocating P-type ATPase [Enterococcus sp. 10A9_DIV0425]OTP12486.1 cadmium-translocating P-type ATPase [Enterococcus sp. 10A9_DIV0425]
MKSYQLEGLDCANCAMKIEKQVKQIHGVKEASVNFATGKLTIEADEAEMTAIENEAKKKIVALEPNVTVTEIEKKKLKPSHKQSALQNHALWRIGISALGLLGLFLFVPTEPVRFIGFLITFLIIGFDVLKQAVMNIRKGQVFDENFLMSVATIGAMAIGEYPEAVAVMLFYQIGEYFQHFAVDQSRRSIRELMAIRPEVAHVETATGIMTKEPEDVQIGEKVIVKPGERVPLDGKIISGESLVDTSALTGESLPKKIITGEAVLSGFINKTNPLTIVVEKTYENSTISKLLELVENASSKKAPAENFITKFARYYTPIVVGLAVLLAVVPPVLNGADFSEWIYRALTFLVISCPCALVISVPLSFFGGIGGASKIGVLVKGGNYLELLARTDTVVFDKTGTLTKGDFSVQKVVSEMETNQFMQYIASVESVSTHPIAKAVLATYDGPLLEIEKAEEIAGEGMKAKIVGETVLVGNQKLLGRYGLSVPEDEMVGTHIYLAVADRYLGYLVIADTLKTDAVDAIAKLKEVGVKKTVMLTGDSRVIAEEVAQQVGVDAVYSELLPEDKVKKLEEIMKTASQKTAFVGDGINDAPVLARADIGIAMGGLGSDAAIEAADVVIMNDEPSKIAEAIQSARRTLKIVKQNIVFAIGIKVIVLILGALGFASMGNAVFADVGVTVLAVLNAMRGLYVKNKIQKTR